MSLDSVQFVILITSGVMSSVILACLIRLSILYCVDAWHKAAALSVGAYITLSLLERISAEMIPSRTATLILRISELTALALASISLYVHTRNANTLSNADVDVIRIKLRQNGRTADDVISRLRELVSDQHKPPNQQ